MGVSVRTALGAPVVAALVAVAVLVAATPVALPGSASAATPRVGASRLDRPVPAQAPAAGTAVAADTAGTAVRSPQAAAPSAVQAPERLRVVSHNVEKRSTALQRALTVARRTEADVVTLQEVCGWQAARLQRALPLWTVGYKPSRANDRCRPDELTSLSPGSSTVGNVVIWTGGPGGAVSHHTFGPQRVASDRVGLACVAWLQTVRHRACSVHLLSPSAPEDVKVRTAQARDLRRITTPWVRADDVVVLGGDFNAKPERRTMRQLYARGGVGRFREASSRRPGGPECRCPRSTYDRRGAKIDYVFYSANRTAPRAPRGLRIIRTVSDHHLLVGWADLDASRR